tara:strand:- start:315 stop:767 length:453 start_codon:yes stop_codon:yes gene_type:complete
MKHKIIWLTGQPGSGKTTLGNEIKERLITSNPDIDCMLIDGDDLRDIIVNKDYSKEGRRKNIQLAIDISKYLQSKNILPIICLVAPYKDLRDSLKEDTVVCEVYLYTDEERGREHFFASDYEPPVKDCITIDTGKLNIEESVDEILAFYW